MNKPETQLTLQDPYLEIIKIFDSIHMRAEQREAILAWHHKQQAQALTTLSKEMEKKKFEPEMDSEGDKYLSDTKDGINRGISECQRLLEDWGKQ
jgi:hypothetical protein